MSTKKKRITFYLDEHLYERLKAIPEGLLSAFIVKVLVRFLDNQPWWEAFPDKCQHHSCVMEHSDLVCLRCGAVLS